MRNNIKNDNGFGLIGFLAILTLVIVLCSAGWLVYKSDKTSTSSSGTASNKDNGYKTLRLDAEKLKLEYPSDWILGNTSKDSCDKINLQDRATLLYVSINTCKTIQPEVADVYFDPAAPADPIYALGKNYYLEYRISSYNQAVISADIKTTLDASATYPSSLHATLTGNQQARIAISIGYTTTLPDDGTGKYDKPENESITLAKFKDNASFDKALKVIGSLTYQ